MIMEENSLVPRVEKREEDLEEERLAMELVEKRRMLCRAYNSKEGRALIKKAIEMGYSRKKNKNRRKKNQK